MTKAALLLAMVSGFMLAAGAANAATLPNLKVLQQAHVRLISAE